jgi:hypothetical protein
MFGDGIKCPLEASGDWNLNDMYKEGHSKQSP